ncbi:MAG: hypothetical protein LWW86_10075 [Micrococcales bacterium]|nr:hypothetical protein [Micrococcales bacterium]
MTGPAARTIATAGLLTAALALTACSDTPGQEAVTSTVTVQAGASPVTGSAGSGQATPASGGTASSGVTAPTPPAGSAATSATTPARTAGPVAGAPSFAGGPAPAGAIPVAPFAGAGINVAVFRMPSGNIGCEFSDSHAGCGIQSYIQQPPAGLPQAGSEPSWWVDLGTSGQPTIGPKGDAPYFTYPGVQVLQWGQVARHGDYVCASAKTGLTCWNSTTGHGAFMSKQAYRPF